MNFETHEKYHKVMLIASSVRKWAEKYAEKEDMPDDLTGMCGIASAELSRRLTEANIPHEIHLFNDFGCHVFIAVDDHVLDVTATQFHEFKHTKIVFRHYKEAEQYYYYQPSEIFANAEALRKHQLKTNWPMHQTALPAKHPRRFA